MKISMIVPLLCGVSMLTYGQQYIPVKKLSMLDASFVNSDWNGKTVPNGQQCKMFEGNGSSPEMKISNIPKGTNAILVSFNDNTFIKNDNGGHGIVGLWIKDDQTSVVIPSVAGESNDLPPGMFIEERFRSNRGKDGVYLPPCSGGLGNEYNASIKAVFKSSSVDESSTLLGEGVIALGKY